MRVCLAVIALALPVLAQEWTLERLYTRPYIWGTPPQSVEWSKEGHTLVFRWNAGGELFRDLYAFHPESKRLATGSLAETSCGKAFFVVCVAVKRARRYRSLKGGTFNRLW